MTTRITLAILLTTWAILIVGQTGAFLTARSSLLALLDHAMITRAVSVDAPGADAVISLPQGEVYQIDVDEQAASATTAIADQSTFAPPRPALVGKSFETRSDGRRARTVT